MITKQDLLNDLKKLNINNKETLMVHSSYKAIGDVEGGADSVVDALIEFMKDGLLVVPTHTWDNVNLNNPVMIVNETPVCIGIIPETFRKRENVKRSLHPTHSVGAIGKDAEEFISGEEKATTPAGKEFVYGKLYDREATILLIGVDFRRNTYIHMIEETANVPNRMLKEFHELFVVDKNGAKYSTQQNRHIPTQHASETYWILEKYMEDKGAIKKGKLGNANVIICDGKKLKDELISLLNENIHLLDTNKEFYK